MEDKVTALADLFRQTGEAHHQAYIATNGTDADWPIWYADYLYDKLPQHLGVTLNKGSIIYIIMGLDFAQKSEAPGSDWAQYYARTLLMRYL
jgi:hypothetical protein